MGLLGRQPEPIIELEGHLSDLVPYFLRIQSCREFLKDYCEPWRKAKRKELFGGQRVQMILYEFGLPHDHNSSLQDLLDPERHEEMVSTYLGYQQQTEKPILVIVGRHHIDAESSVHRLLLEQQEELSHGLMLRLRE